MPRFPTCYGRWNNFAWYACAFDWLLTCIMNFTGQIEQGLFRQQNRMEFKLLELTATRLGYAKYRAWNMMWWKKNGVLLRWWIFIRYVLRCRNIWYCPQLKVKNIETELFSEGVDLDYSKSLAWKGLELKGGNERNFSDINIGGWGWVMNWKMFFVYFDFSAKWDIVPSLLHKIMNTSFAVLPVAEQHRSPSVGKTRALVAGRNKQKPNVRYHLWMKLIGALHVLQ